MLGNIHMLMIPRDLFCIYGKIAQINVIQHILSFETAYRHNNKKTVENLLQSNLERSAKNKKKMKINIY